MENLPRNFVNSIIFFMDSLFYIAEKRTLQLQLQHGATFRTGIPFPRLLSLESSFTSRHGQEYKSGIGSHYRLVVDGEKKVKILTISKSR